MIIEKLFQTLILALFVPFAFVFGFFELMISIAILMLTLFMSIWTD